jgi:hypothetical protein
VAKREIGQEGHRQRQSDKRENAFPHGSQLGVPQVMGPLERDKTRPALTALQDTAGPEFLLVWFCHELVMAPSRANAKELRDMQYNFSDVPVSA